jgi:hypothetical protein
LETPRSSSQDASPATRDLSSVDRTQAEPHSASIAKRFSARVKSTHYRIAPLMTGSPRSADIMLWFVLEERAG